MIIAITIFCIYLAFILLWWILCAISSKNAIRSSKRAHFDFVEMLDIALMRFWRFVSYATLAGLMLFLILIGKWYFAIIPLFWYIKVFWFGSFFYLPFNIVESHYMAKVAVVFGAKQAVKDSHNRQKQVNTMKEKGWTIPDSMK